MSQINNYLNGYSHFKPEVIICNDETELVNKFIQFVNNWDPEVICGYEVSQMDTMSVFYYVLLLSLYLLELK